MERKQKYQTSYKNHPVLIEFLRIENLSYLLQIFDKLLTPDTEKKILIILRIKTCWLDNNIVTIQPLRLSNQQYLTIRTKIFVDDLHCSLDNNNYQPIVIEKKTQKIIFIIVKLASPRLDLTTLLLLILRLNLPSY